MEFIQFYNAMGFKLYTFSLFRKICQICINFIWIHNGILLDYKSVASFHECNLDLSFIVVRLKSSYLKTKNCVGLLNREKLLYIYTVNEA